MTRLDALPGECISPEKEGNAVVRWLSRLAAKPDDFNSFPEARSGRENCPQQLVL